MKFYSKALYLLVSVILLCGCSASANPDPINTENVELTADTTFVKPNDSVNHAQLEPSGLYEHSDLPEGYVCDKKLGKHGDSVKSKESDTLFMDDPLPQVDSSSFEPTDHYNPGIRTFLQVEKEYIYAGDETDIQVIAEILCEQLMVDMMIHEKGRDFVVTAYIDLQFSIFCYDDENFDYPPAKLDENTWFLAPEVKIRYTGIFSPIGECHGEDFFIVPIGERYIVREGATYRLVPFF